MTPSESPASEEEKEGTRVQVPYGARFTPPDKFSDYIGFDYIPIGIYEDPDTERWIAFGNASEIHATERFEEEFPTKDSAVRFVVEEKLSPVGLNAFRYAVVYGSPRGVEDIIFSDTWQTYRVMQSRANDGWVHGYRGDHDYNPGSEDKKKIIEGAKESVIEKGYDRLLIEDENQDIEAVWVNCFLSSPSPPA